MRFLDEVRHHFFSCIEVSDDAIFDRPHRSEMAGAPAEHVAGGGPNGFDRAVHGVESNERGFVDDDAAPSRKDAEICGTEVDGEVCTCTSYEHGCNGVGIDDGK